MLARRSLARDWYLRARMDLTKARVAYERGDVANFAHFLLDAKEARARARAARDAAKVLVQLEPLDSYRSRAASLARLIHAHELTVRNWQRENMGPADAVESIAELLACAARLLADVAEVQA